MEVFLVILSGTGVFILGQIVLKFVLDPVQEQKKLIAEVADALVFYANLYSNPGDNLKKEREEAQQKIRQLGTLLLAKTYLIPAYDWFACLGLVPSFSEITNAHHSLIGISNGVFYHPTTPAHIIRDANQQFYEEIKKNLKIR